MASVSLKFDGKIIEELSQKIPSTLFALNELIKNSYDAFSPEVKINIEPSKLLITISDTGNGMNSNDIERLFHISRSSKDYGHEVKQGNIVRVTQGSKGLGFLAAFKFGDNVTWTTCKDGIKSSFSLNKSILTSQEDLSGFDVPIAAESHNQRGTKIVIKCNSAQMEELLTDLNDEKISEKLIATMLDESFNVDVKLEHHKKGYSTNRIKNLVNENESRQLFHVKYNSTENIIYFYHLGELLDTKPGLEDGLLRTDYSINLELLIFDFSKTRRGDSISPLYIRTKDEALHPLVYINRNLFNNTVLFDPDILRKKKSDETLPQMIGQVCIASQSSKIDFNSDRTNFVENELTRNISRNLKVLNELIQTKGAELKTELKRINKGKIPTGKASEVTSQDKKETTAASITLNRKKSTILYTNTNQIDLEDYIFQVIDSNGDIVHNEFVDIFINGKLSSNRVLPTVKNPCKRCILFKYNDPKTGEVARDIELTFEKHLSSITGVPFSESRSLFPIESNSGYKIKQGMVSSLTYAIDKAWLSKSKDDYIPLIACSIRTIFDISADNVFKTRKTWLPALTKSELDSETKKAYKGLTFQVVHVIILLKKNQGLGLMTSVAETTGIEFTTLSNLLDLRGFKTSVEYSHTGAHRSSSYLTKPKIQDCASQCGLFAVICDALCNFDADTVKKLNIAKVEESDLKKYLEPSR